MMALRIGLLGLLLLLLGAIVISPRDVGTAGEGRQVLTYSKNFTNIHFVKRGEKVLMIDAGLPGDEKKILKFLDKEGISPKNITHIILTHAHPDHAGTVAYFQKNYGVKVISGKGDSLIIQNKGLDKNLCVRDFPGRIIANTIAKQQYEAFLPDILVEDELDLETLGWEGKVKSYPSHTPGSLVILMNDVAFVGDMIRGKNLRANKPTQHLFICDLDQNMDEIEAVSGHEGLETWYLGHLGPLEQKDVLTFIQQKKQ